MRGWFLQQLQEGVGGLIGTFLRDHALGVADDDDFSFSDCWLCCRPVDKHADGRHEDPFHARWRGIQPRSFLSLANGFDQVAARFIGVLGVIEARPRKDPQRVRVREFLSVTTVLTAAARAFTASTSRRITGSLIVRL